MSFVPHVKTLGNPKGLDLVLLHGWGSHSGVWASFHPYLTEQYAVTLIDLPGFGKSQISAKDKIIYQAEELYHLLRPYLPRKAIYIGWSLGGMLAWAWAALFPQAIRAVVAIASNVSFVQRLNVPQGGSNLAAWPHAMPQADFDYFRQGIVDDWKKGLSRFASLQTQGSSCAKEDLKFLRQLMTQQESLQLDLLTESLDLLETMDLRVSLSAMQQPALHILGTVDCLVPAAVAPSLKKLHGNHQVELICGAAHIPFISHAGTVASLIDKFIKLPLTL